MKRFLTAAAAACVLTACGGGGGDGDGDGGTSASGTTSSSAQGLRTGTSGTLNLTSLVLENDEFWTFYTVPGLGLYGFTQGTQTGTGNTRSGTGDDFGVAGNTKAAMTLTSTGTPQGPASGTTTEGGTTTPFDLPTYDSRYDQAASLTDLAGTWSLTSLYVISPGSITSTVTIAANGSFTGSNPYCSISGTATPRSSGKNVFTLSASFTGVSCNFNGQTLTGVALLLKSGSTRQLTVAALRADRQQAFLAAGSL